METFPAGSVITGREGIRVPTGSPDQASAAGLGCGLAAFRGRAGLDLPKEPLNILPFLDFLSPLPM